MPKGLKRFQEYGSLHFLTFSCYRREPLLNNPWAYNLFECELEAIRKRYRFAVLGYVLMPEHVHLLVSEPAKAKLSVALQVLKQVTSRKLKVPTMEKFWQPRYYDFNVWSAKKHVEKLRYMHRNPVKRGLVLNPEQWKWSSFRHYAFHELGTVEIESEWTAMKREAEQMLAGRDQRIPPLC
jgi:putative transposase